MPEVISFVNYTPPQRFDSLPWTEVRIEEADEEDGTYTQIDVSAISPVDADPENPAARSFTTQLGTAVDLWYRVVFADADGDTSVPTVPVQNSAGTSVSVQPYITAAALAALLKVNAATNEDELERVIEAAAGEINSEIGRDNLAGWEISLAAEVNLERAVEHWHARPVGFAILGLDSEAPIRLERDTWDRHANKLAPLKQSWGVA